MRPYLARAAHALAMCLPPTQRGCITHCGTPFCSKIDHGARASLSSLPDAVEPPQAVCHEPQHPCCECRRLEPLSSSRIDLRSDATSKAEQQKGAGRALMGKHVGQTREGEHNAPERAVAILGDSLDRREPTVVVRARMCVTACDQICLRDPTNNAVNHKDQDRNRQLQGELARCCGVQGRMRHLLIAPAATSRYIFMRTMALALGTFLGNTQRATHHGQERAIMKAGWCSGMYLRIFQHVSGEPYHH